MPNNDDADWFKQVLRATFPYIVTIVMFVLGTLAIIVWAWAVDEAATEIALLERAHSHNDYMRKRPLDDALALGFCSVEADIHLVDGALLVAHDLNQVAPEKTLEAMYLKPLWARFQAYGHIYPTPAPFTILIDIKSDGEATFAALHTALQPYAPMLTTFDGDGAAPGAVTAIISGNRAVDAILTARPRLAGVDGRLSDLDGARSAGEMPLVSDHWFTHFTWRGQGAMPEEEAARLRELVARAHAKGMRVRFWAIPHREELWQVLYDAGVDLINADNLPRLYAFLMDTMPTSGD